VKYNTAVITYFVIPAGASSGQRIVLDGVMGEIDLYNANNELVGQWKPSQFGIFAGSPNVGQSIAILPNSAADAQRPSIEYQVVTNGNPAIIDSTNDGTGAANLNLFGAVYLNTPGRVVAQTVQLHTGFAHFGIIDTNGNSPGGYLRATETTIQATVNSTDAIPVPQSLVALNGASHTITLTPNATQTGGIKTPTLQAQYSPAINSAWLNVQGAGIWAPITMLGGYTAGVPAPAITLLPDGTLAFRGVMQTPAAPVSGDVCMSTGTALAPSATRALSVMTLTNPNNLLQLNYNTDGSFRIYGGAPNPPAFTNISLDSIPPIPVAF
jgi:hypothetical protein